MSDVKRRLRVAVTGGVARAVAARAGSILGSFLLALVVARLLGVEAAGSYFLVFTSIAILATFGRLGTDTLVLKICGGDSSHIRSELGYSAVLAAAASVVGVLGMFVVVSVTGYSLPGFDSRWMFVIIATAIPQSFAVIAGALLRARGHLAVGIIAELGSIPVLSVIFLGVLRIVGALDLTTALITLAVASWLTALWSVLAAVASLRREPRAHDRSQQSAGLSTFINTRIRQLVAMMGTSLLFYVLTWSPLFALSITSSLTDVSYYTVAARLANVISLVPTLQIAYLSPAFARFFHRGQLKELNALSGHAVRQAALLLIVPVLILTVAAEPIVVLLYGKPFMDASGPLAILTVGALVVVLAGQVNQLMLLCNLEGNALVLNLVLVASWATAGLWVASHFGAIGACYFSVIVGALYAAAAAVLLRSRRQIRSYLRIDLRRLLT